MVERINGLEYAVTNENLNSIVSGLDLDRSDAVLAVGGCGDPAFALLEKAARVRVMDRIPAQIRYISMRAERLKRRDFDGFLRVERFGRGDYQGEASLKKRNQYFRHGNRLTRIMENLDSLEILEGDIFEHDYNGFSKIFLSNAFGFARVLNKDKRVISYGPFIHVIVRNIARGLEANNLIYDTSSWAEYSNADELNSTLSASGLIIDPTLSSRARQYPSIWEPTVYKKVIN